MQIGYIHDKKTTQALCLAAATAFSTVANSENKLEFPIQPLPKVSIPFKPKLIAGTVGHRLYAEVTEDISEKCPSLDLQYIDCEDSSAYFTSCSIVQQPYLTGHGSTIDIDLARYETVHFSRQEMMAQFLVSSIQSKTESDRLWRKNGRRAISGEEMNALFKKDDNPNKQANMLAESTSLAINEASFHLGRACGVSEPAKKTKSAPTPSSKSNMLGLNRH